MTGAAWLLGAGLLALDLLGRLPGASMRNARAYRLQQTAMLVLMTMALLSQVAALAQWDRPIRKAIGVFTMLAGIGALAAMIKAATMWSEAKRSRAALDASSPASPTVSKGDG